MMAGNNCDCHICRLKATLLEDLNNDEALEEYRVGSAVSEVLGPFPNAHELIAHLHRQSEHQSSSCDAAISEVIRVGASRPLGSLWQALLLLVFIPTIHRTTSQISAAFPTLGRKDTAQYLFVTFLEFLQSEELRSRRSHLAFAVARRMRRSGFRWAIRESRLDVPHDGDQVSVLPEENEENGEEVDAGVLLAQFLDDCQRRGWLSQQERQLLTEFKLEGLRAHELARRNGRSATAIHRRIQRVVDRLRRIARQSGSRVPEQLELFRS
ncbi:MAG: hypothetical protein WA361_00735 [Candidatus Acidiferrales bacterium]